MNRLMLTAAATLLGALATTLPAYAVTCAAGPHRAGCAGPNGAAVVRRPPTAMPYYRPPPAAVACGAGPYRAGCAVVR